MLSFTSSLQQKNAKRKIRVTCLDFGRKGIVCVDVLLESFKTKLLSSKIELVFSIPLLSTRAYVERIMYQACTLDREDIVQGCRERSLFTSFARSFDM